ncbi:hypothetical protein DHEL01_v202777 [Diaporthe helianthi]|uniref:Uncharacterized protein n=1 Tax=Diaporthe helianthi TaxID=158607 RepID=A0A2P5I8K0_DIAHE|nr:hypothetical protein DHEL01_v202777 [Diaporthe helianthi]
MAQGTIDPALLNIQPANNQDVSFREAARYPLRHSDGGGLIAHMLTAQLRLPAKFGGRDDGPILTCPILNDTGSTITCLYRSDWQQMNVNNIDIVSSTPVMLADGSVNNRDLITYEIRLISYAADGSIFAISDWLLDRAVLLDDPLPGSTFNRLSGDAIRRNLWFLTTPYNGNNVSAFRVLAILKPFKKELHSQM